MIEVKLTFVYSAADDETDTLRSAAQITARENLETLLGQRHRPDMGEDLERSDFWSRLHRP